MVFIVQWLRHGKQVHEQAMLGQEISNVAATAKAHIPEVVAACGVQPDTLVIYDALTNVTTTERLRLPDA